MNIVLRNKHLHHIGRNKMELWSVQFASLWKSLNKSFWMEAVVNVVYTHNRYPTKALPSITPKET